VIKIGEGIPSHGCVEANAHALARYAALCQEGGVVPIVEPEVLMDGDHTIERCYETTEKVLRTVFNQLYAQRVAFELMILKPNMVMPGKECPKRADVAQVAEATVTCLLRAVPAAVCVVAFLSGGQSSALSIRTLERHEWQVWLQDTLATDIFLCSRHPAASPAALAGPRCQCENCPGRFALSSEVQQCCETGKV